MSAMKEKIEKCKEILGNKTIENLEQIRTSSTELQQQSLKVFETAYRKVCLVK